MIKAVRRCHDVSNVRVHDAAWGQVLERRSVKAHVAGAVRKFVSAHACGGGDAIVIVSERATAERLDKLTMSECEVTQW